MSLTSTWVGAAVAGILSTLGALHLKLALSKTTSLAALPERDGKPLFLLEAACGYRQTPSP